MSESELVLIDEEGEEHHFHLYRVVEVAQASYALLQPSQNDEELVVLRIEGPVDSGNLVTLDDEEWERVAAALDGQGILDVDDEGD